MVDERKLMRDMEDFLEEGAERVDFSAVVHYHEFLGVDSLDVANHLQLLIPLDHLQIIEKRKQDLIGIDSVKNPFVIDDG